MKGKFFRLEEEKTNNQYFFPVEKNKKTLPRKEGGRGKKEKV